MLNSVFCQAIFAFLILVHVLRMIYNEGVLDKAKISALKHFTECGISTIFVKSVFKSNVPYTRNARTHSKEQILQLRSSLREFGFVNPVIVDKELNIIAGHGRIMAAKEEGLTEIPCVFVEHLTEAQKKAYILADNRLALSASSTLLYRRRYRSMIAVSKLTPFSFGTLSATSPEVVVRFRA